MPDFLNFIRAQQAYGWPMHNGGYMHGGYWGLGSVVHAVVWIVIVAAIVTATLLVMRYFGNGGPSGTSSALDRLDERYASGEIDRDEYLLRKKDILAR